MDTKAFYTDEEMAIEKEIARMRVEKRRLRQIGNAIKAWDGETGGTSEKKLRKTLKAQKYEFDDVGTLPCKDDATQFLSDSKAMSADINSKKEELRTLFDCFNGIRTFRAEFKRDSNVVSLFESTLTRTIGAETAKLTHELIIVKACYFKVLQDIVLNGFFLDGKKYVYFTASAGQIRTKRSVFIREDTFKAYSPKLMCGLSVERINELGGINTNKYLAYLALCNSATDLWEGFDINKTIVVDDMETSVRGLVDYMNPDTYEITRKEMDIPINQTDGCGMVRLDVSKKSFMIRLPWVKGLLVAFPFDKFVREANRAEHGSNYGVIKDIYGVEHDILKEDIQVIFTKSQFKTWKYYTNWNEYQTFFRQYGCEAGICNVEPDVFDKAKINYQMLQTLRDMSDDEMMEVAAETIHRLKVLAQDRNTMLDVFSATSDEDRKSSFQKCLLIYPELLRDPHCRRTLLEIRKRIEREAKAGKLYVDGVYTFVSPDLYAFCQYLFLEDKNPRGLLANGEVYCRLFDSGRKLDCLRAPHLSMEHAVRTNVAGKGNELSRWYKTDAIYVSCHDLISKIIMNDWDGDKSLVVADDTIIAAAERNAKNIVPMYYEMRKAAAASITPEAIYEGMIHAYTGGNIGQISNDITKIWNSSGLFNYEAIQYLAMENNHVIDYAKTLYKPTRPDHVDDLIRSYTKNKVPHFFTYAKDKGNGQVSEKNDSCVNRLEDMIPSYRFQVSGEQLGKFNPKMLMSGNLVPNNEISGKIVDTFLKLSSKASNHSESYGDGELVSTWPYQQLLDSILCIHSDKQYVTDVLVRQLFIKKPNSRKTMFWTCFGDVVLENLKTNVKKNTFLCAKCGKRLVRKSGNQTMCPACAKKDRMVYLQQYRKNHRNKANNS